MPNNEMPPKLVAIIGKSNSGKTTLITRLIPLFRQKGLRIGTIKHTHHQVEFDKPGKDSWKHRSAGSSKVLLLTESKMALFSELKSKPTLKDLVNAYFLNMDIVLSEGFKNEDCLKIEIHRSANGKSPLYLNSKYQIHAIISDQTPAIALPYFKLDAIDQIHKWICQKLSIN